MFKDTDPVIPGPSCASIPDSIHLNDPNFSATNEMNNSSSEMTALHEKCKALALELKKEKRSHARCSAKLKNIEHQLKKHSKTIDVLEQINSDADSSDEKAIFLLDLIHNYKKKSP